MDSWRAKQGLGRPLGEGITLLPLLLFCTTLNSSLSLSLVMGDALGEHWDRDTPGLEIPSQDTDQEQVSRIMGALAGEKQATGFTVYLAGPIHGKTDAEAIDWREIATIALNTMGYKTLNPMDRDYRGREGEEGIKDLIVEGDKEDILNSEVILAYVPSPSAGTSMEILFANERGKMVISVVPDPKKTSPWIHYHSDEIVSSFGEAMDILRSLLESLG